MGKDYSPQGYIYRPAMGGGMSWQKDIIPPNLNRTGSKYGKPNRTTTVTGYD